MSAPKRRYSSEADPTRDRILAAALECISRTAAGKLSVRAIAATAGVNVATVHYYFRTKDALVTEALGLFFSPVMSRLQSLLDGEGDARSRLEGFLLFYIEQFHEHPGIFTSLIEAIIASDLRGNPDASNAYEKALLEVIGLGRPRIMELVRAVTGRDDEVELALRTLQVMTGVVHPMFLSSIPLGQFGVDFRDPGTRRRYVALLVDSLGSASPVPR
ncbi:MAG: TetR/AcrR family transcriptional regulator [Rectinemataceae bacterium]